MLNRLERTGILEPQIASDHGVVGIVARSTGIRVDARTNHPYAAYNKFPFDIATEKDGDVYARFHVRVREVYTSIKIIQEALKQKPVRSVLVATKDISLKKNCYAVGVTEGWRGEIVYFVATDSEGNISRVDVRDPSFLNWMVIGHAAKDYNIVPDFPLINKSFNLSYSGFDV